MARKVKSGWVEESNPSSNILIGLHWNIITKKVGDEVKTIATIGERFWNGKDHTFLQFPNSNSITLRSNTSKATRRNIESSHRTFMKFFNERNVLIKHVKQLIPDAEIKMTEQ